jgi:hypothetical protein
MRAVTKHEFVFLLHLASLSVVAMAPVGVFFGVGFLLLAPPDRAASPAESASLPLALEAQEAPPPRNDEAGWGSSPGSPPEEIMAIDTPDVPSNRQTPVLEATTVETAPIPPAGITRTKRIKVDRHRQEAPKKLSVALWRPDASAGPNPGGGFYGPPNINIGHINPK